jgi:hypothetical protein
MERREGACLRLLLRRRCSRRTTSSVLSPEAEPQASSGKLEASCTGTPSLYGRRCWRSCRRWSSELQAGSRASSCVEVVLLRIWDGAGRGGGKVQEYTWKPVRLVRARGAVARRSVSRVVVFFFYRCPHKKMHSIHSMTRAIICVGKMGMAYQCYLCLEHLYQPPQPANSRI